MIRHLFRNAALAALTLATISAPAPAQSRDPQIPDLKVETYTLPNGLEVILHEDHTTPVVGVNLWYKVGSKDEETGRTGFAHLFEHLMFQGSKNHDAEYFAPLESLGANINGSTNTDRTNYFETLPANGMERALWLESDRMGFLLSALTQAKLDNQRDVVKNERRQRVDNVPYGQAYEKLLEALYPSDHPYHHSVIGSMADLSAASLSDVANFFRTYYTPNNASLVIAGDFEPAEAKRLVEQYFGAIPRGPEVTPPKPRVPTLEASKHVTMTDKVALGRASLTWFTAPRGHEDEPALDVLASVLGGLDKENRLFKALMYEEQLAASVSASHPTSQLSGTFSVVATARPDVPLDDLVTRIDAEIERLKTEGPTEDEVAKAQTASESALVYSLEDIGRKADFLNSSNVQLGSPGAYKDEMVRLFAVTPEDVKRVANKYLAGNRVRLDVTPGEQAQRAPEVVVDRKGQAAIAPEPVVVEESFDRSKMPEPGPNPTFSPPTISRRKLSNGLNILIAQRHSLPIVSLNLVFNGGQNLDPLGKEGLASMTADLLTEGTTNRDSLALAGDLARIGARLNSGSGRESADLSMTTLAKHVDEALNLFADVLLNPAFPEKELERLRKERITQILRRKDSPPAIAQTIFGKLLYGPEHPYGSIDTVESIKALDRDRIIQQFKNVYKPGNATLIVAGDVNPDEIVAKLESALADWKPSRSIPATRMLGAVKPLPTHVFLVDKPGSAQSVMYAGQVGVPRSTPDYDAIEVLNGALGGQFSSRINLNLREEKGYTYGARSRFDARKGAGPFQAGGSFQTAVTAPALVELVKELTEIREARPVSDAELAFAKGKIIQGFPAEFGTTFGLARKLEELALYDLPDDTFSGYQERIEKVTTADVTKAARKHIDPDHLMIVIVGDRSKIESEIKALPFVNKITIVDEEGNVQEESPAAAAGSE